MSEQMLYFLITFGYLGILVATYFEHLFPLLPTHLIIPLAGVLVGQHQLDFGPVLLSASVGGVLGSFTLYGLGLRTQETAIYHYAGRMRISEVRLKRLLEALEKYGELALFTSHLMPITPTRMVFSILMGMNRLSAIRFLFWASVGTVPWLAVQLYISAYVGENWQAILFQPQWLLLLLVLLGLGWFFWQFIRHHKLGNSKKPSSNEGFSV